MRPERPSLWLLPEDGEALRPVLADLAAQHGGPPFAPHLTLLGGVRGTPETLRVKTEALAGRLSALTLSTGAVVGDARWFRCLTLLVPITEALQAARQAAEAAFGPDPRPWTPHISLLYGSLTPAEQAAAIAALPPLPEAVVLSTLALVQTVGPAEDWVELSRFPLATARRETPRRA